MNKVNTREDCCLTRGVNFGEKTRHTPSSNECKFLTGKQSEEKNYSREDVTGNN